MLTSSHEVFMAQNDEKVGSRYFSADFSSSRESLTRSLAQSFHKEDPSCIEVNASLGVTNLGNNWPMKLFFFQNAGILMHIQKMQ